MIWSTELQVSISSRRLDLGLEKVGRGGQTTERVPENLKSNSPYFYRSIQVL